MHFKGALTKSSQSRSLDGLPAPHSQNVPNGRSPDTNNRLARLGGIPDGKAGTVATLRIMRDFVKQSLRDPEQEVRRKAVDIFQRNGTPPRAYRKEINALQAYVRDQIRYVRDPVDLELVQIPAETIEIGTGDCDDKATLLAALLSATGHPARFVAVGFNGEGFSHVLTETKINNSGQDMRDWLPLETILPGKEPGWYPENVTSRYVLAI